MNTSLTDAPPVQLGRVALTQRQRRATEIALYRAADLINRLLADKIQYSKVTPDEFTGGQ